MPLQMILERQNSSQNLQWSFDPPLFQRLNKFFATSISAAVDSNAPAQPDTRQNGTGPTRRRPIPPGHREGAEASLQNARAYAQERLQDRPPCTGNHSLQTADPIIVPGDVRRMLLSMKAMTEGGRAFAVYVARQLDLARYSPSP